MSHMKMLMMSLTSRNVKRIERIAKSGTVNLNEVMRNYTNPLNMMIQCGDFAMTKVLIENGADPTLMVIHISEMSTSLVVAIRCKLSKFVKYLLSECHVPHSGIQAEVSLTHKLEKITPLGMAVDMGLLEIVNMLIDAGANLDEESLLESITSTIGPPTTALAMSVKYPKITKALLVAGASVNKVFQARGMGMEYKITALFYAIQIAQVEAVKMLIDAGADVNVVWKLNNNTMQLTPLMHLILNWENLQSEREILELLLDTGANVNEMMCSDKLGSRSSPLIEACSTRDVDTLFLVEHLVKAGADVNMIVDSSSALINATTLKKTDVVQVLLEHGSTVTNKSLEIACTHKNPNTTLINLLIKYGADPASICTDKLHPDVVSLIEMAKTKMCVVCHKPASKQCSGCNSVRYCGKDCAKSHWRVHKADCAFKSNK